MISDSSLIKAVFYILVVKGLFSIAVYFLIIQPHRKQIEHLCDLFSAVHGGREPIINALLKMGEERELTELVQARAAKQLLYDDPPVDVEDFNESFENVRPMGRLFHKNLFRHSKELVKEARGDLQEKESDIPKRKTPNKALADFLKERRNVAAKKRIRWRSFDYERKGRLSSKEIDELCRNLEEKKDCCLVISRIENNPDSHPAFRARFLLLAQRPSGETKEASSW
jgi:hypothetical protein